MSVIRTTVSACCAWLLVASAWAFQPPPQREFVPVSQLPPTEQMPAAFAWTGLASAFTQAGFVECARGSETRPIMRYAIR